LIRKSFFAGKFYPETAEEINILFDHYFEKKQALKEKLIVPSGLIVPHAGYVFSGRTAAKGYRRILEKGQVKRVFILSPNHTGLGEKVSVFSKGYWSTPLGKIKVDEETANELIKSEIFKDDFKAHLREHSIEVQIPFIQYCFGNEVSIIPITLKDQRFSTSYKIAEFLRGILNEGDLIIASTDLNHYEDHETTVKKDEKLIETLKTFEAKKMYDTIKEYNITMCGYGPVSVLLNLGFKNIEIIEHITSGEMIMEYDSVVGYLSALLY